MYKPQPLPSGMTQAQLREHVDQAIANGAETILVNTPDLMALLVSLDLRQRLTDDVELCARRAKIEAEHALKAYPTDPTLAAIVAAAERVLKHEPKPDLLGAVS